MSIHSKIKNYIARYAPSYKKLYAYLEKKGTENPKDFIAKIGYNETMMLDAWLNTFVNQGKSINAIQIKLYKKEFEKENIEKYIEKYRPFLQEWDTYKDHIQQKIETYIYRKKSQKEIQLTLSREYPYFSDEIKSLVQMYSDDESLDFYMQKYAKKYNRDTFEGRQKYLQALMRRGFSYRHIQERSENNL